VDKSSLRLYTYNTTLSEWVEVVQSGVNITGNYVWGNTTHFSYYTVGGTEAEVVEEHRGGSSGSGGLAPAGIVYTANLDTAATATQIMKVNDATSLTISSEKHSITLLSLIDTSAVVEISSIPQRVTLNLGIAKQVDLNGDGTNDIELLLNSVSNGLANITFNKIGITAQPTTPIVRPAVVPAVTPAAIQPSVPVQQQVTQQEVPLSTFGGGRVVVAIMFAAIVVAAMAIWYKMKK
jgi:hypothetical protein